MYSVFLSSYTNTRESLGELEKAVVRLVFPQHFSFSQTSTRVCIKQLDYELEISIETIVRVFLSRNYRLIVAPRKFDVLKTNIWPRREASRANMLVLRTSNFQGATIRPIVSRQTLYCLYCSSLNFLPQDSSKINLTSIKLFSRFQDESRESQIYNLKKKRDKNN